MRFSKKVLAAVAFAAIVAIVSQSALAQNDQGKRGRGNRGGGPGGGGGFGGPVSMARIASVPKVQDELKLSDEQKEKIKKINSDSFAEMRKEFQAGSTADPEKRRKMREETADKLKEVLNADQQKRLTGIFVQLVGSSSVMDPIVGKEVGLTDDQKQKLHEAMGPPPEGRDARGGGQDGKAKRDKEVASVLTDEQKQKLESLKGEKFEIDMSALRGGGGDRPARTRDRGNRGKEQSTEKKSAA